MAKKKTSTRKTAAKKTARQAAAPTPTAPPAPATIEPKDKAELLLNHYNDTFEYLWKHWLVRNRLFFYLLVLLFLMAVEVASRDSLTSLVTAYLNGIIGKGAPPPVIQFEIISSASWFALLCLVIHYFQRSIQVDRQYQYLSDLEERLCGLLGERAGPARTLEGIGRTGCGIVPAKKQLETRGQTNSRYQVSLFERQSRGFTLCSGELVWSNFERKPCISPVNQTS